MTTQFIVDNIHPNFIECKKCKKLVVWRRETIDGYCSENCRKRKQQLIEKDNHNERDIFFAEFQPRI